MEIIGVGVWSLKCTCDENKSPLLQNTAEQHAKKMHSSASQQQERQEVKVNGEVQHNGRKKIVKMEEVKTEHETQWNPK